MVLRNFQLTEVNAATSIGETKYRKRVTLYRTVVTVLSSTVRPSIVSYSWRCSVVSSSRIVERRFRIVEESIVILVVGGAGGGAETRKSATAIRELKRPSRGGKIHEGRGA